MPAPHLNSMTGFARCDANHDSHHWVWEMRCVNGRGLEVRCRLPHGFDDVEIFLRKKVSAALARGSVNVSLTLRREAEGSRLQLNHQALDDVLAMIAQVQKSTIGFAKPAPEAILAIKGVVEPGDSDIDDDQRADLVAALEASFIEALDMVMAARLAEGQALVPVLTGQIDMIAELAGKARQLAAGMADGLRAKFLAQINDLASDVTISEDRLAQEVAVMAVKGDVREELDRLDAHIQGARVLLAQAGPHGRKFDFLVQELNREANTLCAKAADIELKQTGLALKTVIDQMREQIQNIE